MGEGQERAQGCEQGLRARQPTPPLPAHPAEISNRYREVLELEG